MNERRRRAERPTSTTRYKIGPCEDWKVCAHIAWGFIQKGIPFVFTPESLTLHVNPTDKQAADLLEQAAKE